MAKGTQEGDSHKGTEELQALNAPDQLQNAQHDSNSDDYCVAGEEQPVYYVGIGASAGGLEALQIFFEKIPSVTGAAFIVVQHLSPDFKSMMQQLLSGSTIMSVHTVEDGMLVKRNCVYLIPPKKNMVLDRGRLLLYDQPATGGMKMPINLLFQSLAEDQQHRSIGVILSGTGSDGTKGIKAIKEYSGFAICQLPESAKFDGMPQSALATGVVDLCLPPEEIANRIASLCANPQLLQKSLSTATPQSHEALMREIFGYLKGQTGADYTQYKHSTVSRRIERRMQVLQIDTLKEYAAYLKKVNQEVRILEKELLIGVTRFFRDPDSFNFLSLHGIEFLLNDRPVEEPIRVWVAGCSSGEEAYSLAMLFDNALKKRGEERDIKIFATDFDGAAVQHASEGTFSADSVQDIPSDFLERYFSLTVSGKYAASKVLRQMLIFARHNVISDPPFSSLDLVSCRNTLIYFQHVAQRRVLSGFHFALKRNGLLYLGASESLGELQANFDPMSERHKLYLKKSNLQMSPTHLMPNDGLRSNGANITASDWFLKKGQRTLDRSAPFSYVKDYLIERFIDTVFILNQQKEVLYSYGASEEYLRPLPKGRLNLTLDNLVKESLRIPISTALHRAEAEKGDVQYTDISVSGTSAGDVLVDIFTSFHFEHEVYGNAPFYSIVIVPSRGVGQASRNNCESDEKPFSYVPSPSISELAEQRIKDLEEALASNQEHLLVTVEELETTNEELQSTNEELMSANEELQSTNEELQSVNEELYTVNSEFQQKIQELTEVNDDLKVVLNSAKWGVIFLDVDLTLRKFTQIAAHHFNLAGHDIGRSINQVNHNLGYDDFLQDVMQVQKLGRPKERIVKNVASGRSVEVKIVPYEHGEEKGWQKGQNELLLVLIILIDVG